MSLFRGVGATGGTPKSAVANPTAGNNYMTFESPSGTDFQVTTSKTLKITRVIMMGVANNMAIIGYGDDGVANGAGAPTNPIYVIGDADTSPLMVTTANQTYAFDLYAEIPAQKYPFVRVDQGAGNIYIIGIEE